MNIFKNLNDKAGTNKRPGELELKNKCYKIMPGTSKCKQEFTSETVYSKHEKPSWSTQFANDNLRNNRHLSGHRVSNRA